MSWAEAKNIKDTLADKMSDLANATLRINVGQSYAGRKLMLKRYDKDYMEVTMDSQGTAEVSVQPRSRYELVDTLAENNTTSNVFFVGSGEYKEVKWAMNPLDGDEATPINSVAKWIECSGKSYLYNYTTVEEVLADSGCMEALTKSINATKYWMRSTDIIRATYTNLTFMSLLGASDYCAYLVAMNPGVCSIIMDDQHFDCVLALFNKAPYTTPSTSNANDITLDTERVLFAGTGGAAISGGDNLRGVTCDGTFGGAGSGTIYAGSNAGSFGGSGSVKHLMRKKFIPKVARYATGSSTAWYASAGSLYTAANGSTEFSCSVGDTEDTLKNIPGSVSLVLNQVKPHFLPDNVTAGMWWGVTFSGCNAYIYSNSNLRALCVSEVQVYGIWEEQGSDVAKAAANP